MFRYGRKLLLIKYLSNLLMVRQPIDGFQFGTDAIRSDSATIRSDIGISSIRA
jgi:hypothetical protein